MGLFVANIGDVGYVFSMKGGKRLTLYSLAIKFGGVPASR